MKKYNNEIDNCVEQSRVILEHLEGAQVAFDTFGIHVTPITMAINSCCHESSRYAADRVRHPRGDICGLLTHLRDWSADVFFQTEDIDNLEELTKLQRRAAKR